MTGNDDLSARMADLKRRIDQAEARMKLRVILHGSEQSTLDGLRKRYALLEQQVADETATAEAKGHHVTSFEKNLLWWINTLTFDR